MPRLTKKQIASRERWQRKKLMESQIREVNPFTRHWSAAETNEPAEQVTQPQTIKTEQEDSSDESHHLEESIPTEVNPPVLLPSNMEVSIPPSPQLADFELAPPSPEPSDFEKPLLPEPTQPSPTDLMDIKEEPIELDHSPYFQVSAPDPLQIQTCLFCFREMSNGLDAALADATLLKKIEYVLVAKFNFLKMPCKVPCCVSCVQMFDLCYEFKRNCLAALTKQDELLKAKVLEPIKLKPVMPPQAKKIKVVQKAKQTGNRKPVDVKTPELTEVQQLLPEVTVMKVAKQTVVKEQPEPVDEPKKSMIVYKCSVCPAAFVDEDEHGYHMNEHSGVYPFKCGIIACKQAFPNPKMCLKHQAVCAATPKTCTICSLDFPTAAELKVHNKAHTPSVCPRCKGIFALAKDCENHMTVCQGVESDPLPGTSNQLVDSESFDQDQDDVEDPTDTNGARSCRNCGHKFPIADDILFEHQRKCSALRTRVKCPRCDKCFNRKGTLEAHLKWHDGIVPFRCGKLGCKKTFLNQWSCAKHEEGCGTLGFVCDVCGTTLSTQGSLKLHRDKHDEPKLQCNQCEKRFHDKRSLQKHMSVHSDERNFECQKCGKRFKSAEANRVHQRIHTKEKPYACPECDQRFTYNCSLKAHLEKKACILR